MSGLMRKVFAGYLALFLLLLAVTILSLVVLTSYSRSLDKLFHDNYDSVIYCDAMNKSVGDLDQLTRRAVLEGQLPDPAAIARAENDFDFNLKKERANYTVPGESEAAAALLTSWRDLRDAFHVVLDQPADARRAAYAQRVEPAMENTTRLIRRISDMNLADMLASDGRSKTTLLTVRNVLVALVGAGGIAATIYLFIISTTTLRNLRTITSMTRQLHAENLHLTTDVSSRDEVGELASAFNAMTSRLKESRTQDRSLLRRTQQTTQLAIDSLPDGVVVINPAGVVEIANRSAARQFAIEPGMAIKDHKLPWLNEVVAGVLATKTAYRPEGYERAVQLFDDGHERFLLPMAVPMLEEDQRLTGVAVILVDVTGLRRADEMKGGLAAAVSHELKSPLTSVRMAAHMLLDPRHGPITPQQQTLLKVAATNVERLHRTMENLLSLSRLDAKGALNFEVTRLTPILTSVIHSFDTLPAEKNISLSLTPAPDDPAIRADIQVLAVGISNIVSNAIKFTPPGGTIHIRTQILPHVARIEVQDSGPGIAPEFRQRIFERFFRISSNTPGVGLGLAIAKDIVEAHGGSIGAEEAPTGGALLWMEIPRIEMP